MAKNWLADKNRTFGSGLSRLVGGFKHKHRSLKAEDESLAPTSSGTVSTIELPNEILLQIFKLVDNPKSIMVCHFVCKHWRNVLEGNDRILFGRHRRSTLPVQGTLGGPWFRTWYIRDLEMRVLTNMDGSSRAKKCKARAITSYPSSMSFDTHISFAGVIQSDLAPGYDTDFHTNTSDSNGPYLLCEMPWGAVYSPDVEYTETLIICNNDGDILHERSEPAGVVAVKRVSEDKLLLWKEFPSGFFRCYVFGDDGRTLRIYNLQAQFDGSPIYDGLVDRIGFSETHILQMTRNSIYVCPYSQVENLGLLNFKSVCRFNDRMLWYKLKPQSITGRLFIFTGTVMNKRKLVLGILDLWKGCVYLYESSDFDVVWQIDSSGRHAICRPSWPRPTRPKEYVDTLLASIQ